MRHNRIYQAGTFFLSAFLYVTAAMTPITALAAPADLNEAAAQQEERLTLPIQSNEIENWPEGPAVGRRRHRAGSQYRCGSLCQKYPREALSGKHHQAAYLSDRCQRMLHGRDRDIFP